jgi:hypothetical protein
MDNKQLEIRDRIEHINEQIDMERDFLNYAASEDYELRMSQIRIDSLINERKELQKLLD